MAHINAGETYALVASPNSRRLVKIIEAAGGSVISFAPVETASSEPDAASNAILSEATGYDWLIFFDVLTVDYFLRKLEELDIDSLELDAARICAVGEAVADRLRFVRLHADVIPLSVQAAPVFTAISSYIGADLLSGKRFLLVKRKAAASEIKSKLLAAGAWVDELEIYETKTKSGEDAARLKALLAVGAIDCFVFSSPEDLISLRAMPGADLTPDFFGETKICAADEVTFQSLREHGLNPRYF